MDNRVTDILDIAIKDIQCSPRILSPITYQLNSNSNANSGYSNVPIKGKSNTIIDKTLSLLRENKANQEDNCLYQNNAMKPKGGNSQTNNHSQNNRGQLSTEKITKSNQKANSTRKGKNVNWEKKYEELRQKLEEAKKNLVNERKTGKELEKQFNRLNKKEQQYNELIDINQRMLQKNEHLYQKVTANEKIAKEQEEIINSLQLEIKRYKEINTQKEQ